MPSKWYPKYTQAIFLGFVRLMPSQMMLIQPLKAQGFCDEVCHETHFS